VGKWGEDPEGRMRRDERVSSQTSAAVAAAARRERTRDRMKERRGRLAFRK
jgi:hypothetical protein